MSRLTALERQRQREERWLQAAADRAVRRQLGGPSVAPEFTRDSLSITEERKAKLRVQLARVAEHLSQHRIVPRIEELAKVRKAGKPSAPAESRKPHLTPNMLMAIQYYAALAFVADGPSVGVARYGEWQQATAAWRRSLTNDERMQARALFDRARAAAFSLKDRYGNLVFDELARQELEPVLLGDDTVPTWEQIGYRLSSYTSKNGAQAAAITEVVQVARRLRLFFRLADDEG
ncbi:MAG TPA: hypothetical protein VNK48_14570 [Xanthobacteraceae bacterium]|nr:hypothetical protein [Xanthobacteraceae bacterium]